jgi:hypothetical protein
MQGLNQPGLQTSTFGRGTRWSSADGNATSVGGLIMRRSNDRRLRFTATDWVKKVTGGPSSTSPGLVV